MNKFLYLLAFLSLLIVPVWAQVSVTDADGDMLLDTWETTYGLNSNLWDSFSSGMGDYWDDPDHDGLANHSELVAGTNPTNAYTYAGGTNDYNKASGASWLGKLLTDNDHIDDRWEVRYQPYTSLTAWDERSDLDGDGWDNWSERRAGTIPSSAASYPKPTLVVTVDYSGVKGNGAQTFVVQCYTDPYMQGLPNAVYQKTITVTNGYPLTVTLTHADVLYGHIRQNRNYFFAFLNSNGSISSGIGPSWSPGEPAALADGHAEGVRIGWEHNKIRFGLTDEAKSFARFAWEGGEDKTKLIEIENLANTKVYFSKSLSGPRTWLHEGDIVAGKSSQFGIAWGYAASPDNVVKYRVANGTSFMLGTLVTGYITNNYSATLDTPVAIYPRSAAEVYDARPEFRFRLAPEATEFDFTLTRGGSTVFTGRYLAPPRRVLDGYDDVVVWSSPFYITPTNTYSYTVKAYSPAQTAGSDASTAVSFLFAPSPTVVSGGGLGWLRIALNSRSHTAGQMVRIEAYNNSGFAGNWCGVAVTNSSSCTVTIPGLVPGKYYVKAFIDADTNGLQGGTEAYGYCRSKLNQQNPFAPIAVYARFRDVTPTDLDILGP